MFVKPFILIFVAILLIIAAVFSVGCARFSHCLHSPEKRAEWVVKKISGELDLNDTQKAKLNEIKSELIAKRKSFSGMRSETWSKVSKQIKSDKIDEAQLNALLQDKEAHFREMRTFLVSKLAEFHAILNPEQRIKLVEKINEFHNKFHQ